MKKVLKQQASELDAYIKRKHTQEECIGFIDGFERANKLFALYSVSQQRELLLAFVMREFKKPISDFNREGFEKIVDNFLANNCG